MSKLKSVYSEFLALIHELVEWYLTQRNGTREEDITAFDVANPSSRDPGSEPNAPYRNDYELSFEIDEPADPGACYLLDQPMMNCPLYKIWLDNKLSGHVWFGTCTIEVKDVIWGMNSLKIRYYPYPTNLYESTTTSTGIIRLLPIVEVGGVLPSGNII